jgi:hypothetical protein
MPIAKAFTSVIFFSQAVALYHGTHSAINNEYLLLKQFPDVHGCSIGLSLNNKIHY